MGKKDVEMNAKILLIVLLAIFLLTLTNVSAADAPASSNLNCFKQNTVNVCNAAGACNKKPFTSPVCSLSSDGGTNCQDLFIDDADVKSVNDALNAEELTRILSEAASFQSKSAGAENCDKTAMRNYLEYIKKLLASRVLGSIAGQLDSRVPEDVLYAMMMCNLQSPEDEYLYLQTVLTYAMYMQNLAESLPKGDFEQEKKREYYFSQAENMLLLLANYNPKFIGVNINKAQVYALLANLNGKRFNSYTFMFPVINGLIDLFNNQNKKQTDMLPMVGTQTYYVTPPEGKAIQSDIKAKMPKAIEILKSRIGAIGAVLKYLKMAQDAASNEEKKTYSDLLNAHKADSLKRAAAALDKSGNDLFNEYRNLFPTSGPDWNSKQNILQNIGAWLQYIFRDNPLARKCGRMNLGGYTNIQDWRLGEIKRMKAGLSVIALLMKNGKWNRNGWGMTTVSSLKMLRDNLEASGGAFLGIDASNSEIETCFAKYNPNTDLNALQNSQSDVGCARYANLLAIVDSIQTAESNLDYQKINGNGEGRGINLYEEDLKKLMGSQHLVNGDPAHSHPVHGEGYYPENQYNFITPLIDYVIYEQYRHAEFMQLVIGNYKNWYNNPYQGYSIAEQEALMEQINGQSGIRTAVNIMFVAGTVITFGKVGVLAAAGEYLAAGAALGHFAGTVILWQAGAPVLDEVFGTDVAGDVLGLGLFGMGVARGTLSLFRGAVGYAYVERISPDLLPEYRASLEARGVRFVDEGNGRYRLQFPAEAKIKYPYYVVTSDAGMQGLPYNRNVVDLNKVIEKIKARQNCKPGQTGCFLANTPIKMADGTYKNIQDIVVGEKVAAFDIANMQPSIAEVTTTFKRPVDKYLIIEYEDVFE